jgi:hypothetical protein
MLADRHRFTDRLSRHQRGIGPRKPTNLGSSPHNSRGGSNRYAFGDIIGDFSKRVSDRQLAAILAIKSRCLEAGEERETRGSFR